MTFRSERLKRVGAACAVACGLAGGPAQAWAQDLGPEAGGLALSSLSVYAGLGITTVGVLVIPFALTTTAGGAAASSSEAAALERYLRENQVEVREALAVGQGALVEDLASALGLGEGERAALGQVLRRERVRLTELADPARLTPERAGEFGRALWEAMGEDPRLAEALARRAG